MDQETQKDTNTNRWEKKDGDGGGRVVVIITGIASPWPITNIVIKSVS